MDFLFGADMPLAVRFFFAFVIVLALIGGTAFLVRRFGGERLGASSARGRQPRLAVIDATAVDGRRRLILIRRDNVEHLLMIGGPSDVVVEANIVRAAAAAPARDTGAPRPTTAEPPARSAPMSDNNMWPLAPEPASAPAPAPTSMLRPPPRQQPAMEEPMDWNPEPEAPAPLIPPRRQEARQETRHEPRLEPRAEARAEPRSEMRIDPRADMRMDISPDSIPADPLAGLAAELARVQSDTPAKLRPPRDASRDREPPVREREAPREREPLRARGAERPSERLRPVAPPAAADEPMAPKSADQNLAEMAQRLEAALRRPKAQGDQPRASDAAPSRPTKLAAPSASESMMEPAPIPMMTEPVAANEDSPAPPQQAPTRSAASKPAPQKSVYDSLEQEMASLLGRPNSKA